MPSRIWSHQRAARLGGHPQADSLGDRGEFDEDNSGGGKLYVGYLIENCTLPAPSGGVDG